MRLRPAVPVSVVLLATVAAHAACGQTSPAAKASSDYLYLWTASADSTKPDFLAVVDVRAKSARYGTLVATVPVPGVNNGPHHSEHAMPADGRLFVNGFGSGQSFIFDMANPAKPKLDGQFMPTINSLIKQGVTIAAIPTTSGIGAACYLVNLASLKRPDDGDGDAGQ